MADLVTHWSIAVIWKAGSGWRGVPYFVAGTLLPDLLARVPPLGLDILAGWGVPTPAWLSYFWVPMHLPVGMVIVAFLLSGLVRPSSRRLAFGNLLGGMVLHLAVDLLQDHMGIGYQLLFPFSMASFELGVYGSEDSVWGAPVLGALALAAWWRRRPKASATTGSEIPEPRA